MRPFCEAIRPLIPFVAMFIITTVWAVFSRNDILKEEPRLLFLLFGTVFSNISVSKMNLHLKIWYFYESIKCIFRFQCRLIVAQMSDTRADAWNHLLWPILVVTTLSIAPLDRYELMIIDVNVERVLVYFLTSISTIAHFHYGYTVVSTNKIR